MLLRNLPADLGGDKLTPWLYASQGELVAVSRSGACSEPRYAKFSVPHSTFTWSTVTDVVGNEYSHRLAKRQDGQVLMSVRCRHCPACSYLRQRQWSERAAVEFKAAKLTVFGTLTFSEQWFQEKWREASDSDLSMYLDSDGMYVTKSEMAVPEYDERGRSEELRFLTRELDLYMKRLRKSGLVFRYMAVTEFGKKKGRPHYHFVMHFKDDVNFQKTRKVLKANWEHVGRTDIKVCYDDGAASYAAKYIGKSGDYGETRVTGGVRVRASVRYGRREEESYESTPSIHGAPLGVHSKSDTGGENNSSLVEDQGKTASESGLDFSPTGLISESRYRRRTLAPGRGGASGDNGGRLKILN